jgi:hypothetical protein
MECSHCINGKCHYAVFWFEQPNICIGSIDCIYIKPEYVKEMEIQSKHWSG